MLDETSLTTLQGELGQEITPTVNLDALMPFFITSIAVIGLLTLLFLIYMIFSTIRRFKVEKASLDMQRDIRKIRELMEHATAREVSSSQSTPISVTDIAPTDDSSLPS